MAYIAEAATGARTPYEFERAAAAWTGQKERLTRALEASNSASAELQEAQQSEQKAWEELERSAGRGSVPAIGRVPYPPNPGR